MNGQTAPEILPRMNIKPERDLALMQTGTVLAIVWEMILKCRLVITLVNSNIVYCIV